jgi:hypothetical protein
MDRSAPRYQSKLMTFIHELMTTASLMVADKYKRQKRRNKLQYMGEENHESKI